MVAAARAGKPFGTSTGKWPALINGNKKFTKQSHLNSGSEEAP